MKKHSVMTSQCLEKCIITAIGNMIKMPCRSMFAILANEIECNKRTQSSAGEMHLQGNFSERRSNTFRKTLHLLDLRQR